MAEPRVAEEAKRRIVRVLDLIEGELGAGDQAAATPIARRLYSELGLGIPAESTLGKSGS